MTKRASTPGAEPFGGDDVAGLPDEVIDRLFHALADKTRRDILRRAVDGELSVSQLAQEYSMSFAAVQKHVAVLERAGLINKVRRGREQLVRTDQERVGQAQAALTDLEELWRNRVDRMTELLAPTTSNINPATPSPSADERK